MAFPKQKPRILTATKCRRKSTFHELCKNSTYKSRCNVTVLDQVQKGELQDRWRRKEATELIVKGHVICVRWKEKLVLQITQLSH